MCNNLARDYVTLAADAMFVKAMQLSKEGKAKDAAALLIEHAIGDKELAMKLASVQVLLSHDERKEAIAILENLNERDKSLPGIVSALVTLHMADNDRESASAVLKDAVTYYKKNKVHTHLCLLNMRVSFTRQFSTASYTKRLFTGHHGEFGRIMAASCKFLFAKRRIQDRCRHFARIG